MRSKEELSDAMVKELEDLKKLRIQMGLSQEDFARTVGVRLNTISRWECYKAYPSRLAWERIDRLSESKV